jgi:hypothetical protein
MQPALWISGARSHFAAVWPHVGKGVQYVGELFGGQVLGVMA